VRALGFTPVQRTGEKRFIVALTKVNSEHIKKLKTYNVILRQIKCYCLLENKYDFHLCNIQFN